MREQTPITVLDLPAYEERSERGLLVPTYEGHGLEVVDCADDRNLTEEVYNERAERFGHYVVSGRFFGAASGYSMTALITLAAQKDEWELKQLFDSYSAESFVDFGADISDKAHSMWNQDIVQHSAAPNEMNPFGLANYKECPNPLGCAFALYCGQVLVNAGGRLALDESERATSEVGISTPLEEAWRGAQVLSKYIPPSFGVHRGALSYAAHKSGLYAPIALVDGPHAPNTEALVDIDFAGLRSDAAGHNDLGIKRYHHTPDLAAKQLPELMPSLKLDEELLYASAVLLAPATRIALSGEDHHALGLGIIPREYATQKA